MPWSFSHNVALKHGQLIPGPRGHAAEKVDDFVSPELASTSQSATPFAPRAIYWDESTGLTVAFNGNQESSMTPLTGGNRLDVHIYNKEEERFEMHAQALPLQGEQLQITIPTEPDDNCAGCHGENLRSIWPMYPDWPGFYESDNDELSQPQQEP